MALWRVMVKTHGWEEGDFVEDDGYGYVQKVRTTVENGRLVTGGFEGLAVPLKEVEKWLLRIQKGGLHERAIRECH